MIYYELRIKIDNNVVDADTVEKYREKVKLVQKQIQLYKTEKKAIETGKLKDATIFLDAGFDLFVPKAINIFAGAVSVPINHGIKCAMFIVNDSYYDYDSDYSSDYSSEYDSKSDDNVVNCGDSDEFHDFHEFHDMDYKVPTAFYLYPRSSTGSKTSLRLSNSVGIIDAGYRGYIFALFDHRGGYTNSKPNSLSNSNSNTLFDNDCHVQHVQKNDRLVQICGPTISYPIYPILVSDESELGFTKRGAGGLGSTGR